MRRMTYSSFRRFLTLALALLAFDHGGAQAGVVRDGTVGPGGAIAPVGGDYAILAGFGTQMGGNLFHSFSQFNLVMGESATFSGPNSISNIFSLATLLLYSSFRCNNMVRVFTSITSPLEG